MDKSRVLYRSKYFTIATDERGVERVECGDEVLVVPLINAEEVLLNREPSAAFGGTVLVLPGGTVEKDEDPAEAANRELQEEIGCRAGRLDYLGEVQPWSKYLSVRSHIYLARDLVTDPRTGDEPYEILHERVPLELLETLVESGRLRDGRTISGLFMARGRLAGGG